MAISKINDKSMLTFRKHACGSDKLIDLGFEFSSEEKIAATQASPESFKVSFSSNEKRSVDLVFYPLPSDQGIILVYINNLDNGQVINLKDWLKKHDQLPNLDSFKLASYSGGVNDRWSGFLSFLNEIFSLPTVYTILCGDAWEDIPFDWTGIK